MALPHEPRKAKVTPPEPNPARWRILGFLGVAQLMLILDVTVVAIALPHMETALSLSREALTWTVSAYTLTFGGLMLLGGRITDLVGGKRVLLAGLLVFTAASLATGLATSAEMLVGGRIAQGIGAAMLSPAALSLVVALFEGDERNKALGIWSALGGGGAALGVLLGGLLTAGPGWPWVFLVNVPIGLVIVAALAVMLPARPAPSERPRLDVLGAILVTSSTASLIYALIAAGERGWLTALIGWLVLAAAAGYVLFAVWQRRARSPLMDVRLLVRRPVATGAFLVWMATALMIAVFFLGTFYFQHARGYGALRTGLLFLPVALATMVGANLTGRVIGRMGGRPPATAGLVLAALGMAVPAITMDPVGVVIGVAVAAAGTGAMFVVASATALGQVAPHEAGIASGIVSTFHEFGASFGAAVVSSVAAASLTGTTLTGFTRGFTTAAIASAVGIAAAFLTPGRPQPRTKEIA
ncbi:MFS transporter [Actinomadura sp. NBRC 104412]|uniref:MFS transporter n=1 Tax=Actinomadura sp. NBRC 104412 TaxID=3032203 RepID=UPI00249FB899|nr:MFS transporter [Actinomadura sp. NBRC 104412]GLZ02630.1 MFS transporter [Actinomadura sp. NBRC 104412]